MALLAGAIKRELNDTLSALHGSDNGTYGTPAQAERRAGSSLDDRLNKAAENAKRLAAKGRRDEVIAMLEHWRQEPIRPQVLGSIPNMHAELSVMNEMFDSIVAGTSRLADYPSAGSEANEIRFYTVKKLSPAEWCTAPR